MPMRKLLLLGAAVCLIALNGSAFAQEWPSKEPIKVIVPFTPGSATDIVARAVFNKVSKQVGQLVIVENRGGGGTTIGSAYVAHSDPDGYTLLVGGSNEYAITPALYKNLDYEPERDLTPVASMAIETNAGFAPYRAASAVRKVCQALLYVGFHGSGSWLLSAASR